MLVDVSSVVWMSLLAGQDKEFGREVLVSTQTADGVKVKKVLVNSAQYGYENAVNHIVAALRRFELVPSNLILVVEGHNTKALRTVHLKQYKAGRDSRPPEAYEEFNKLKVMLVDAFRNVGAQVVTQDGVEADDVIAYLARNLEGERIILSNDGDLAVLVGDGVHLWRRDELDRNPYGPFPHKYITVFKALVGDTSDTVPGANGFGEKAFLDLLVKFGDDGLELMQGLIERKELARLAEDVVAMPKLQKILDDAENVYRCWDVVKLHPEWVNTMRQPLVWKAGMVRGRDVVTDERLHPWCQQVRLVTAGNYASAVSFLKSKIEETPQFCLDLETTVPERSEEWLAQRGKENGVDVVASTITGCALCFGNNNQYAFYFSTDHADTDNISIDMLREALEAVPQARLTIAHNAAGFELPVMYNAFSKAWKDNGWRGFFPNMVDSRLAASYWDENQPSHGLKQLTKLLLDYEQTTYAEVTQGRKMDALSGQEVLDYGVDDVYTANGLWNFFRVIMEIEKSYEAFMRIEQKPMYLSALSFVHGTPVDMPRLRDLRVADDQKYAACESVLNAYLIEKGWDGTQCPVYSTLDAAAVKEIVQIVMGLELETKVRTVSKLAVLIRAMDHDDAGMLAELVDGDRVQDINVLVASRFDGKPKLNVGSNKQLTKLLYETMGLPIRLRNKATDVMRKAGVKEGNPRADDDAMAMAIKMGDAKGPVAQALTALTTMKSINTKRGLYWEAYPKLVHWRTNRLHPELRQCATNTRRHTSGNPNIQQLDSEYGGVRSVIVPHHKEAVVVSLDLSGQEIRLLADMSRDDNMMSAYMGDSPKDLHSFTAAMIQGVSYEEFMARRKSEDPEVANAADEARQNGKVTFFAASYGAMASKIAEGLGIPEELAQSYLDALDRAFPRVNEWKKETEAFANNKGWVPIHGGNRRHLREHLISDDKWEAQKALRQASNARIQGAGGNQLRTIMGRIWDSDLIEKYDYRWYFPVHDETVHSIGRGDVVECVQRLHGFMCEQFMDVLPSASSIGIGPSFGELIEIGEVADAEKILSAVEQVFGAEGRAA